MYANNMTVCRNRILREPPNIYTYIYTYILHLKAAKGGAAENATEGAS